MNLFFQNVVQVLRGLSSQAWQVVISTLSIAVSIVCLTYSTNWFWVETNYDYFRPNYKNLYLLQQGRGYYGEGSVLSRHSWAEAQTLKEHSIKGGYEMGLYRESLSPQQFIPDEKRMALDFDFRSLPFFNVLYVDSCAADLLGLSEIKDALGDSPDNIVLTDVAAMKMYGTTDVVGKLLHNTMDGNICTVKAVCPAVEGMSNFKYDALCLLRPERQELENPQFLSFRVLVSTDDAEHAASVMTKCPYLGDRRGDEYRILSPLRTFPHMYNDFLTRGEKSFMSVYFYQIAFVAISLLLLVSAVSNLIMVYTSINLGRVREYALRRSMGSTTWQNVQWMLIGVSPSLIFGGLLSGVAMEWIVKFADIPWDTTHIFYFYTPVLLGVLLLCLLGMAYPVYKMRRAYRSSFLGYGDGGRSHLWLIVTQCMASAFLLFMSFGMQRQVSGMINADLGYDHANMLRLHTGVNPPEEGASEWEFYDFENIYKDLTLELRKLATGDIVDVMPMETDIFNRQSYTSTTVYPGDVFRAIGPEGISEHAPEDGVLLNHVELPFRAIDFFNIRTEDGRKLLPEVDSEGMLQVYLNKEAMQILVKDSDGVVDYYATRDGSAYMNYVEGGRMIKHWANKQLNVVDVANLHLVDFHSSSGPVMFVGVEEFHECCLRRFDAIYIKYAEGRRAEAEALVKRVLKKFDVPEGDYKLTTFDEHIASHYKEETAIANLLTAVTVFSVVITFAGVFSMLLYSLRLRRRSMAIHRVMGAEFRDIFMPTLRPYLIYAFVGTLLAYFPAQILMHKWMEYFHYGETPGVWLMLVIFGCMVFIITILVWWQVCVCMREKPVEILKPES